MTRFAGWIVAGGLLLGMASTAGAQGIVIGNPYAGRGISIGNTGYGNAYGTPYGYNGYNAYQGYSGYGYTAPATNYYSSGYSGYTYAAPLNQTYTTTTYRYPSYGYATPYYGTRTVAPGYGYGGFNRGIGIPGIGRIGRWR